MEKVQNHLLNDLCDEGSADSATNLDNDNVTEHFVGDWDVVMSFMVNVRISSFDHLISVCSTI